MLRRIRKCVGSNWSLSTSCLDAFSVLPRAPEGRGWWWRGARMYRPSGASTRSQSFPAFPDRKMGAGGGVGRGKDGLSVQHHAISQPFPFLFFGVSYQTAPFFSSCTQRITLWWMVVSDERQVGGFVCWRKKLYSSASPT